MNKEIFLSVLVPVYNVENFLNDCIESLLAQKGPVFEVILVDDGSTDSSGKICDTYQKENPDIIRVIHKKNEGLISARRVGLQNAHGEYITWVDSDDTVLSGYFWEIEKIINTHRCDMIIFNNNKINGNGCKLYKSNDITFKEGFLTKEQIFREVVNSSHINQMWRKVCKRNICDIDADYSKIYSVQNGEDIIQSMPLFYAADTFYFSEKSFYNYRINTSSLTRRYQFGQYRAFDVARSTVYLFMEKAGYSSEIFIRDFYRFYLNCLWENLYLYVSSNRNNTDKNVFEEIINYSHVIKAERFTESIRDKIKKRCLMLFYARKWDKLENILIRCDLFIRNKKQIKIFVANKLFPLFYSKKNNYEE